MTSEYDRGILYRVYINEEWDMSAVYGFRKTAEDGRKYLLRYLTKAGKKIYEAELWVMGITEIEFEEEE